MANTLLEKVLSLQDKYQSLQDQLSDPEVMSDMKRYVQLNKDYKELQPIINAGHEYKKMVEDLAAAKDIVLNEKDEELKEMAKAEIAEIEPQIPEMEQKIKLLLIPADPDDGKNAMVEIRGGTGGHIRGRPLQDVHKVRRVQRLESRSFRPGTGHGRRLQDDSVQAFFSQ